MSTLTRLSQIDALRIELADRPWLLARLAGTLAKLEDALIADLRATEKRRAPAGTR